MRLRSSAYKKNIQKFSAYMKDVKDEIHIEKYPTCPECDEFINHCECEDNLKKKKKK